MLYWYIYSTPIGEIYLEEQDNTITRLSIAERVQHKQGICYETEFMKNVYQQLIEYFHGERTSFSIPVRLEGTVFQKKVWQALQTIPYGETRSYGEVAKQIGNPKASRAVGGANHRNPVMILVPCHRVIGAKGELTGFAAGVEVKQTLLELEKAPCKMQRKDI